MPNHVTNRCRVTGTPEAVMAFLDKMITTDEEGHRQFDFNVLVPMPEELMNATSTSHDLEWFALGFVEKQNMLGMKPLDYPWVKEEGITTREELLAWIKKHRPGAIPEAIAALERVKKYGHTDWYSWSVDNWGTKWNSYDFHEASDGLDAGNGQAHYEFTFDTAWAPPLPIFAKIAEEFPEVNLDVVFFDECWNFAGRARVADGDMVEESVTPSKEFYAEVYGQEYESDEDDEED